MPGLMPGVSGSTVDLPAHPHLGFPGQDTDHGARQLCPSAGADHKRQRPHGRGGAQSVRVILSCRRDRSQNENVTTERRIAAAADLRQLAVQGS